MCPPPPCRRRTPPLGTAGRGIPGTLLGTPDTLGTPGRSAPGGGRSGGGTGSTCCSVPHGAGERPPPGLCSVLTPETVVGIRSPQILLKSESGIVLCHAAAAHRAAARTTRLCTRSEQACVTLNMSSCRLSFHSFHPFSSLADELLCRLFQNPCLCGGIRGSSASLSLASFSLFTPRGAFFLRGCSVITKSFFITSNARQPLAVWPFFVKRRLCPRRNSITLNSAR